MQRKIISAPVVNTAAAGPAQNFDTSLLLGDYLELVQSAYVKDMLSFIVPNNNNSTKITSCLSINTPRSEQHLYTPLFIPKINFREILSAKTVRSDGVFRLTLKPYIVKSCSAEKRIEVSTVVQRNGEELENLADYPGLTGELFYKILQQEPPINPQILAQNIRSAQPMRLPELVNFPPEIRPKLTALEYSHSLIQRALLGSFQNYLEQLEKTHPEIPLVVRAAMALEACQSEALHSSDTALRIIEDITYLADCIFNQNISGQSLGELQKTSNPLAIISEYFTLEDIMQVYLNLPERARQALVFISAWEPDFIPQETKINSKTIRNDDAQEFCASLKFGYHISDATVANFKRGAGRKNELVLSILNRDSLHNGKSYYTGGVIVANTPREVVRFVSAYNQLFQPNQAQIFNYWQFHKREILLNYIYGQFGRRMITHNNPGQQRKHTAQQYADYIRRALRKCIPRHELLTKTDLKNLRTAVNELTNKALRDQAETLGAGQ